MLRWFAVPLLLSTMGCVSLGYHQRKLAEAKRETQAALKVCHEAMGERFLWLDSGR